MSSSTQAGLNQYLAIYTYLRTRLIIHLLVPLVSPCHPSDSAKAGAQRVSIGLAAQWLQLGHLGSDVVSILDTKWHLNLRS